MFDFYDMYYLLKSPHKIRFFYNEKELQLESVMEGDECVVCFGDKWNMGLCITIACFKRETA